MPPGRKQQWSPSLQQQEGGGQEATPAELQAWPGAPQRHTSPHLLPHLARPIAPPEEPRDTVNAQQESLMLGAPSPRSEIAVPNKGTLALNRTGHGKWADVGSTGGLWGGRGTKGSGEAQFPTEGIHSKGRGGQCRQPAPWAA